MITISDHTKAIPIYQLIISASFVQTDHIHKTQISIILIFFPHILSNVKLSMFCTVAIPLIHIPFNSHLRQVHLNYDQFGEC